MHFIIDSDSGDVISGWLAPDNPSAVPRLILVLPGQDEIEIRANVARPDIRDMGLHATGECGFHIGPETAPDLARFPDVELLEAASRVPIYRRYQPGVDVPRKLFLFDCSIIPQTRLLNQISSRFALCYFNAERHGLETTVALIANPSNKSVFFSGRPNLMRYNGLLRDKEYLRVAILREPHEELAERLYFFNFLVREQALDSFAPYTTGVRSLLEFSRDLPFNDLKALTGAFRTTTEQQRRELASPMTKALGCDIDEMPKHANVSRALECLADFDVVGTRERFPLFKDLIEGVVGTNIFGEEQPVVFQSIKTLAEALSKIGLVNDLLADDQALYAYVDEAISQGLENPEGMMQRAT